MALEFLAGGQALAAEQLNDIASASDGALEVVQIRPPSSEGGNMLVRVSVDTREYRHVDGGFSFRAREAIQIYVPARYPIDAPIAYFAHTRFMGRPHVQWGNFICLHQATDVEWSASDGMYGFVTRLDQWLRDAALNELDPDDAPLHPPVTYTSSTTRIAIEVDPPEISERKSFWLGTAKLSKRNSVCYDVEEWDALPESLPRGETFAAALLLNQPMPMEYPNTVSKLIASLGERHIPFDFLFSILKLFAVCQNEDEPLYFVLGAPMRRRSSGEPLRQHLTAWSIEPKYVAALRRIVLDDKGDIEAAWKLVLEWAIDAKTEWCGVYDNRPEVTFRRDQDTGANWFLGKRIALLGCGAIGSHIGEYLVRSGAAKLRLIDNSAVNPGILVRQQFKNRQVGYTKQSALYVELSAINPTADIDHLHSNLIRGWPESLKLDEYDLIIDATASKRVAAALQLQFEQLEQTPPILRCAISGRASHGIATMRMKKSPFGPSDLIRQTKLAATRRPDLTEFLGAFWPEEQQEPGFQPEPGCSEPTFVGSAADVAFFASSFFNLAAEALVNVPDDTAQAFYVSSPGGFKSRKSMTSRIVDLGKVEPQIEVIHNYHVLLSPGAKRTIRSEIALNARTGSADDETGGLLLGEIDDALATICLDAATGAPPDSMKSPERFVCGVEGTERRSKYQARQSGGSTKFVGVWHTHPVSMPEPSDVDLGAMAEILHIQERTPRHVVMLIVGHTTSRPVWRFHLFRKNQFRIIRCPTLEADDAG